MGDRKVIVRKIKTVKWGIELSYLLCTKCKGYYKLQLDESPEDFKNICECGGKLKYIKDLDELMADSITTGPTITCPQCGFKNHEKAQICKSCHKVLKFSSRGQTNISNTYNGYDKSVVMDILFKKRKRKTKELEGVIDIISMLSDLQF